MLCDVLRETILPDLVTLVSQWPVIIACALRGLALGNRAIWI